MHRISFWTLAALGLLFTTVRGLLNHGNTSIVPDGTGIGNVWTKLYELQAQVLEGRHQNGELIRNQTAIKTQMTDLRKENEELRRNQTLLMHENGKIKTQLNKTMTILNDFKGKNEELRINQTRLQNEELMGLRTDNNDLRKNQTLLTQECSKIHNKVNQTMVMVNDLRKVNEELRMNHTSLHHEATHLKTVITALVNTVSSIQSVTPVDVKLNLLNSTIEALHTLHSYTASIVTSLQGKQNIMDGSIMSLNTSLQHLHGSIGIDIAALNSSFIRLGQYVKNLSINVNKNNYVLYNKVMFSAKMNASNRVKNGILQYTHVITNVGGGYNPAYSMFTAPLEGHYVFSWSTSTWNRRYTLSSITKNGARILSQSAYAYTLDSQGDSTSETTVLHLVQGDIVWINLYKGDAPYMDGAAYEDINVFTGFLL